MNTENQIEQEIQTKGLTAPRITPDHIDSCIKSIAYHVFPDTVITVCCLTLKNGFNTTGVSVCDSPENFDKEIGESIAFRNARDEIWRLEVYLLKDTLSKTNG